MISEEFQAYIDENKDRAKTQAESSTASGSTIDIPQQLSNAGGSENNIFACLYLMQKGMAITPKFDPIEKWDMPDDVKSVADLFGQDVAEFVSKENRRFSEAQLVDPHAENKAIRTAQDLVNLMIDNGRSWFPTVADPGSPPQ
jgi:hypothetical protein